MKACAPGLAIWGLATWAGMAGVTFAYVPAPNAEEIAEAARRGAALAAPHTGYPVQDYILFAVPDALALRPGECVDAVQLATPYERTQHASYLAALSGHALPPDAARAQAGLPDRDVAVTVFAHGGDEDDEGFLDRFAPAALAFGDHPAAPDGLDRSPPFRDGYPHAPRADQERYVGTVTFRFQLDAESLARGRGVLSFTDPCGKAFSLPVDLAKFR